MASEPTIEQIRARGVMGRCGVCGRHAKRQICSRERCARVRMTAYQRAKRAGAVLVPVESEIPVSPWSPVYEVKLKCGCTLDVLASRLGPKKRRCPNGHKWRADLGKAAE